MYEKQSTNRVLIYYYQYLDKRLSNFKIVLLAKNYREIYEAFYLIVARILFQKQLPAVSHHQQRETSPKHVWERKAGRVKM